MSRIYGASQHRSFLNPPFLPPTTATDAILRPPPPPNSHTRIIHTDVLQISSHPNQSAPYALY